MIQRMPFGRTGHSSSRVIFGAAALSRLDQQKADELLELLVEFKVNHLDTAISYGDAELRMAPWLAAHPDRFFVATKTEQREGGAARASLERSLERLGVDSVDLVQLHNLVEEDDWHIAMGPGGAAQAMERARDEGLVRYIGVTGHGLRIAGMHLRSLQRFDFDSVLLPYSFVLLRDDQYRRDVEALLEVCAERDVAVQTIKSVARRRWSQPEGEHYSWYEPVADVSALRRCVAFVLSNRQLFLNSSSEPSLLRPLLEAASATAPDDSAPDEAELAADVKRLAMAPLFDRRELETI